MSRIVHSEPYGEHGHTLDVELYYSKSTPARRGLYLTANVWLKKGGSHSCFPMEAEMMRVLPMARANNKVFEAFTPKAEDIAFLVANVKDGTTVDVTGEEIAFSL